MSPSVTLFRPIDALRHRSWGNDSFALWLTDDALCGLRNHKSGPSSGIWPVDLLPLGLDAGLVGVVIGIIAILLFIPVAIMLHFLAERRQQKAEQQLETLDPTSSAYLMWDLKNFRLELSGIKRAEFFEPKVHISSAHPVQNLRLHFETGEVWRFTLPTRSDVEELQALLDQKSIPTSRRYGQSLTSYVTDIFGGP